MAEKDSLKKGDGGAGAGAVYVVGIGPGSLEHLTERAKAAIRESDCIVGYTRYVGLIEELTKGKEVFSNGMTFEVERCRKALEMAGAGRKVSVISSGDSGIYGMAGLILQISASEGVKVRVEVVPGIPAFVAAASILGAPLMHDFASISLSDLLTDWEKIEERVDMAARADFVIALYNPKSSKRVEGLGKAIEIVRRYRKGTTPVGLVRNATREGEEVVLTTLDELEGYYERVDMLSIIIIGNSTTFRADERMVTPRGYRDI
ncbi:MAG: precorrin-3B C(17)-methyltransferase [Deltaproteobacteria bacterium]|nr:precorrin-3B C(17)-methyltransferase [Deltaproteobacteria bacterium]